MPSKISHLVITLPDLTNRKHIILLNIHVFISNAIPIFKNNDNYNTSITELWHIDNNNWIIKKLKLFKMIKMYSSVIHVQASI